MCSRMYFCYFYCEVWLCRQHQPQSGHNPRTAARLLPTTRRFRSHHSNPQQHPTSPDSRPTTDPPTTNRQLQQSRWCVPPLLGKSILRNWGVEMLIFRFLVHHRQDNEALVQVQDRPDQAARRTQAGTRRAPCAEDRRRCFVQAHQDVRSSRAFPTRVAVWGGGRKCQRGKVTNIARSPATMSASRSPAS